MKRKQNEVELSAMMRKYGFNARKSRDRGYINCPTCHTPVLNCPKCHSSLLLPKAETLPDYVVSLDYIYIEGKAGRDSWNWKSSITPTQEKVCLEHESWLFLEMGTGRAPKGRSAWFLPWVLWKRIQNNLENEGFSSLIYERTPRSRNPVAVELLIDYSLTWSNGHWIIPTHHLFWKEHAKYKPKEEEESHARSLFDGITEED